MKRYEIKLRIGKKNLSLFVYASHLEDAFNLLAANDAAFSTHDKLRVKLLLDCRAYFRPSNRQNTIGDVVFKEGDIAALIHECGHAAYECARRGLIPDNLCSRHTDEERVCVALGIISEAVLSKVRHAIA